MEDSKGSIFTGEEAELEAGLVPRTLSGLVDFAIQMGLVVVVYKMLPPGVFSSWVQMSMVLVVLFVVTVSLAYHYSFLFMFNKTVGMMIFRLKHLNKFYQPLSAKDKLKSVIRSNFSGIKLYKEK